MQFLIITVSLSLCLLLILQCSTCDAARRDRKLMRVLKKGMPPSEKSFLTGHKCYVIRTPQRNDNGFARWQVAKLRCKNVEEEELPIAICDERCTNPRTNQVLSTKYASLPYTWAFKMMGKPLAGQNPSQGKQKKQVVHLPISCICGKSKRRHRNKTSKKRRRN